MSLVPVLDFPITGSGPCSTHAREIGYTNFARLAEYVRMLPYGRVEVDAAGLSVLRQERGTCSSKHRFLAIVARECGHTEVTLTLGLYQMSERNTPGVGPILAGARLASIPEAHCYLSGPRKLASMRSKRGECGSAASKRWALLDPTNGPRFLSSARKA
jgi:hypothetical protein